jgi:hypothetical protein
MRSTRVLRFRALQGLPTKANRRRTDPAAVQLSKTAPFTRASYRGNSERTKDDGPQERKGGENRENVEFQRQTHQATSGCLRQHHANPARRFRQLESLLRRKTHLTS